MRVCRRCIDDEAVSPVIGVILGVAITVVLAGVIFLVVNGIGSKSTKDTPTPVFGLDDVNDKLTITTATVGADWTRVQATATTCTAAGFIAIGGGGASHQNTAAVTASSTAISSSGCTGLNSKVQVTTIDAPINAGDFIAFCSSTGSATNVDIQLTDMLSNTVLGTYRFTSIHPC